VTPIEALESRTLLSTTWFVATTGSDSNSGTLAAPFRTIQHGADAAKPGDTVDVRGGVYHETVTVHKSGTAGARITFQPYNNEAVTIDGADAITGFTNAGGAIWTAPMPVNLGYGNNQVFVDGQMMNEARWPNTGFDLSHPTLATVASASPAPAIAGQTTTTINDPNLTQPANFWVGATIRIGSGQNWANQTGTVTASGPGFVTVSYYLTDPMWTVPTAGNDYYLFGTAGALDAPGEFFRSASGQLSLETPAADNPANHKVEVKTRLYGFDISSAAYVQVSGFHFFACTIKTSSSSTAVVINHITAQYVSQFSLSPTGFLLPTTTGIILAGSNDVLENSVIVDSAGDGVYVSGSHVTVSNNLIHDVDYAGVDAAPIRIGGYADLITRNTCYNTGRNGLLFSGNDDTITYNNVYNYGLQTTDLGGFYAAAYNGRGTVIAYNKFHDGMTGGYGGTGIMFDEGCSGFIVYRNITWNVKSGIRINGNTHNMQIYNNTFDAVTYGMDKDGLVDDWTGVILENNILTKGIEFATTVTLIDNLNNHMKFVDYANHNYTLTPDAPALDAGMLLPPYTNGYVGKAPDVGALELGLTPFAVGAVVSQLPHDPTAP
jgi:hypothetical protein